MNIILRRTVAISALLLATVPSHAAVIEYRFTAAIDSLWEYDGITKVITNVARSDMPGTAFTMGDAFTGSFTYSTDVVLTSYQPEPPATGSYRMYGGYQYRSDIQFASGYRYDGEGSFVQVADNASTFSGWDIFSLHTNAGYSPVDFQSFALNLFDRSATVFDSAALPAVLPFAAFSYANIDYTWLDRANGSQMHASGRLTSLELVETAAEVPVAPTAWLFIAGLSMLVGLRRRPRCSSSSSGGLANARMALG
jgi:hypothetical protein